MGNQRQAGSSWLIVDNKNVKIEQVGDKYQTESEFENHLVIRVNWYEHEVNWAGAQLPTEAERDYAESGPDGSKYPWGNEEPSCKRSDDNDYLDGIEPNDSYHTNASLGGILDLEGNAFEWINDWFDLDYYAALPVDNPHVPETSELKVVRSASWGEKSFALPSYLHRAIEPNHDGACDSKLFVIAVISQSMIEPIFFLMDVLHADVRSILRQEHQGRFLTKSQSLVTASSCWKSPLRTKPAKWSV